MAVISEVNQLGQQIWLDNLSRSLIQSGELARMLDAGISGVTSNPAIFQKAFAKDPLYSEDIVRLKQQTLSPKQRYELLAVADVQAACDVCLPLYQQSKGRAGLVSLEVAPDLADDTSATITEALRLWQKLNRPNAMIKIPATDSGLAALTKLIAQGVNINLTLLFSKDQVQKAYQAHAAGIRQRLAQNLPVDCIQVVASFFLSRIDNALDTILPTVLQGKTAVALAKTVYAEWLEFIQSREFKNLSVQQADPVRLLWASTATKNPHYSDVVYIENVIGQDTINTIPAHTLNAFIDHGTAAATISKNLAQAKSSLIEIEKLGINLESLATRLLQEGIQQFIDAFDTLLQPLH
jgi:transaldolase